MALIICIKYPEKLDGISYALSTYSAYAQSNNVIPIGAMKDEHNRIIGFARITSGSDDEFKRPLLILPTLIKDAASELAMASRELLDARRKTAAESASMMEEVLRAAVIAHNL